MARTRLGQMQLKIMQQLWRRGRATAREITDALNQSEPVAHSTVQTLLRQLEAKGAVAHDRQQRTFVFHPVIKEDRVKTSAARELIQNVFGGQVGGLVAYLLENEKISREELKVIRRLIDKKGKSG